MSHLLAFLGNIRITITQAILGLMALTIGGLVMALRLQGSKLHKAQVALLEANFGAARAQSDLSVAQAKAAFQAALDAYKKGAP